MRWKEIMVSEIISQITVCDVEEADVPALTAIKGDAGDTQRLLQIVDLLVNDSHRRRGYGSTLIRTIECIDADAGYERLYIDVEPFDV